MYFLKFYYIINLYGTSDMSKIEDDFEEEYNKKLWSEKLSISQFIYNVYNNKNILNAIEKEYDKINPTNFINGKEPPFIFKHRFWYLYFSFTNFILHNELRKNNFKSIQYHLAEMVMGFLILNMLLMYGWFF